MLLRRSEWFLVQHLCKGSCSEGGHWPIISYGFILNRPRRSCFVPYLVVMLQAKILNSHRPGYVYSKHRLRVNSDIFCFNLAVASPNKNNNNNNEKNMEKWRYLVVTENHLMIELNLNNLPKGHPLSFFIKNESY